MFKQVMKVQDAQASLLEAMINAQEVETEVRKLMILARYMYYWCMYERWYVACAT